MIIPFTLFRYISRQFLIWFVGVFLLVCLLIYIGNFVELTREATIHVVSLGMLSKMAALQLPQTAEETLPFAVLLASILALWRMTRSQELIVARAAGISVWQFLMPAIVIAFLIGTFGVTVFNPVASKMQAAFQVLKTRLVQGQSDAMALSSSGLWLRQRSSDGTQAVIHALAMTRPGTRLETVTFFFFRDDDHLVRRLDAAVAVLQEEKSWKLEDVYEWRVEREQIEHIPEMTVATNLTTDRIEESFAAPETMSFWTLPSFIALLEKSGFPAHRHRLYFDSLLARPFLLCAMVLVAAIFSLRMQRRGGTAVMLVGGVSAGFMLWFLSVVVSALGTSGTIPVVLAAGAPAGISMLLGATFLLHLEDG